MKTSIKTKKIERKIDKEKAGVATKKIKKGAIDHNRKKINNKKIGGTSKSKGVKLQRADNNPIIEPTEHYWESKATFNPAALYEGEKVHLVYRAIGNDDISALGYASSKDGINIDERLKYPIYRRIIDRNPSDEPAPYGSGGGWNGGCEDPRLTAIEDKIYLVYTAFDGWGQIRLALSCISKEEFLKKRWNWSETVFLSPPGEIHKNWVLFPEKINGKFAILHSVSPEISIEYVDNFEDFGGEKYIKSYFNGKSSGKKNWDNLMRGTGPSPIRTSAGWLLLYHAMDTRDPNRYKIGALILDINDPSKILYRSKYPILEPDEIYENEGFKAGVVYCCGAVVKDENLFIYYGGADKFSCVATIPLNELIEEIKDKKPTKLARSVAKKKIIKK